MSSTLAYTTTTRADVVTAVKAVEKIAIASAKARYAREGWMRCPNHGNWIRGGVENCDRF